MAVDAPPLIPAAEQRCEDFRFAEAGSAPKSLSICLCTRFAPAVGGIETLAETLAVRMGAAGEPR